MASVLAVFVIVFLGLANGNAAPVTIRFSSGAPENHFLTKQYIEWAKLIESNSKGDIKVQVYHSAQLYRDNEVLKAVQTGALESGCAFTMYIGESACSRHEGIPVPFSLSRRSMKP